MLHCLRLHPMLKRYHLQLSLQLTMYRSNREPKTPTRSKRLPERQRAYHNTEWMDRTARSLRGTRRLCFVIHYKQAGALDGLGARVSFPNQVCPVRLSCPPRSSIPLEFLTRSSKNGTRQRTIRAPEHLAQRLRRESGDLFIRLDLHDGPVEIRLHDRRAKVRNFHKLSR